MTTYIPDAWVVLQITNPETNETIDKVFAGWRGGYITGDSWKLNSGNKQVIEYPEYFEFHGYSGSVYKCIKSRHGMTGYMGSLLAYWEQHNKHIKILEGYDVRSDN